MYNYNTSSAHLNCIPDPDNRAFLTQISFKSNSSIPEKYTQIAFRIIPTDIVHNVIYAACIVWYLYRQIKLDSDMVTKFSDNYIDKNFTFLLSNMWSAMISNNTQMLINAWSFTVKLTFFFLMYCKPILQY